MVAAAAADPAEAVIEVAAEAAEAAEAVPAAEVEVEEAVAEGADAVANAEEVAAAADDAAADARPAASPNTTPATTTTASRGLWSPVAEFSNYIPTDTAFSAIRGKTISGCGAIRSCPVR